VVGRDLFTDEVLSPAVRTAAIIGAVTAGVGDKPLDVLRAIAKLGDLGVSGKRAETIINVARHSDSGDLTKTTHALERAAERGIDEDVIDDALDRGTRWWDIEEESLLMIEVDPTSANRAVAVIDPDSRRVATVYLESRRDDELEKVLLDGGRKRFHRIDIER